MSIKAYMILIKGRVTGVGFRYYTLQSVNKFHNITGYVRNVTSSKVEVLIQGDNYDLMSVIELLKVGPSGARVTAFLCNEIPLNHMYVNFSIK